MIEISLWRDKERKIYRILTVSMGTNTGVFFPNSEIGDVKPPWGRSLLRVLSISWNSSGSSEGSTLISFSESSSSRVMRWVRFRTSFKRRSTFAGFPERALFLSLFFVLVTGMPKTNSCSYDKVGMQTRNTTPPGMLIFSFFPSRAVYKMR